MNHNLRNAILLKTLEHRVSSQEMYSIQLQALHKSKILYAVKL